MKRFWLCLTLVCFLTFLMGTTVWGADTKIETVKVTFSYDKEPKSGGEIGTIYGKTPEEEPYTVEEAYYVNENDAWVVGDRPVVKVRLTAKSGYQFYYTTKSHFTLNGCSAVFKRAKKYDGNTVMELEVYLKRVGGTLSEVQNVEWSGTKAAWDRLEGAKSYDVRLYRDESVVVTISTPKDFYDFSNNMDREGVYTFRVRAIASYNDRAGAWSDYSEDYYVDEEDEWRYYGDGAGSWHQDAKGWWYAYYGGGYPRNCWKLIDNKWYYFDGNGYMAVGWRRIGDTAYYMDGSGAMVTGWLLEDGAWYYLDGSGSRTTGWQMVNGRWYYLNPNGIMLTGWQDINGTWYYLDGSGAMLTGWQDINGTWYYLNGSGAMLTGWQNINGTWYYLNGSGAMLTGWQNINGLWYYLDGSGAMLTGWQNINGTWYYLNGSGSMLTGWQNINGYWYYLDSSGGMLANAQTPDGYYVNEVGKWQ